MWLQWELAHPLREILVPPPPNNMNTCVIAIVALDLKEITKTVEDVGAHRVLQGSGQCRIRQDVE